MFRFTIRDVFWLTVVVALLSLWAIERQFNNPDWSQIQENEGRLHARITEQRESIQKLSKQLSKRLADEHKRLLEIEQRLAEAEARGVQLDRPQAANSSEAGASR